MDLQALILTRDPGLCGSAIRLHTGSVPCDRAHDKDLAAALSAGLRVGLASVFRVGGVLHGHSSLDRVFGYGSKSPRAFHPAHLGWLGQRRTATGSVRRRLGCWFSGGLGFDRLCASFAAGEVRMRPAATHPAHLADAVHCTPAQQPRAPGREVQCLDPSMP